MRSLPVCKKILAAISAIVILAVFIGLSFPSGGASRETRSKSVSWNAMHNIALLLVAYANDHHDNLPQKLSDLVPDYLEDPKLLLFRSPDSAPAVAVDLTAHRELIDLFSGYSFLRLADHRLLVFERLGFRKDNKMIYLLLGNDRQPVGFCSNCYVSSDEFIQRLDRGFPDTPTERRYQTSRSVNIGTYEYTWDIFGEKLHSLHQAFQASGKPPIAPDAARAKVQAAMDLLDPPGTWQVENGIRASDGSTPYYHFQCDQMKDGRQTEESVEALVLLDGTVIAPRKLTKMNPIPGN